MCSFQTNEIPKQFVKVNSVNEGNYNPFFPVLSELQIVCFILFQVGVEGFFLTIWKEKTTTKKQIWKEERTESCVLINFCELS